MPEEPSSPAGYGQGNSYAEEPGNDYMDEVDYESPSDFGPPPE